VTERSRWTRAIEGRTGKLLSNVDSCLRTANAAAAPRDPGARRRHVSRASALDASLEVGQCERMLVESARKKRILRVRRHRCGAAVTLAAALGLVGCGAPQAERNGSRAPVAGTTGEHASGTRLEEGKASYYSDRLAGHPTASGEAYDPRALTAAHRTLPFGTTVDVARPDGRHVTVRINDRGPHRRGRVIDVSRAAAEQIGLVTDGVGAVSLRVVSLPPEK
jgi:rare lipoprotein A